MNKESKDAPSKEEKEKFGLTIQDLMGFISQYAENNNLLPGSVFNSWVKKHKVSPDMVKELKGRISKIDPKFLAFNISTIKSMVHEKMRSTKVSKKDAFDAVIKANGLTKIKSAIESDILKESPDFFEERGKLPDTLLPSQKPYSTLTQEEMQAEMAKQMELMKDPIKFWATQAWGSILAGMRSQQSHIEEGAVSEQPSSIEELWENWKKMVIHMPNFNPQLNNNEFFDAVYKEVLNLKKEYEEEISQFEQSKELSDTLEKDTERLFDESMGEASKPERLSPKEKVSPEEEAWLKQVLGKRKVKAQEDVALKDWTDGDFNVGDRVIFKNMHKHDPERFGTIIEFFKEPGKRYVRRDIPRVQRQGDRDGVYPVTQFNTTQMVKANVDKVEEGFAPDKVSNVPSVIEKSRLRRFDTLKKMSAEDLVKAIHENPENIRYVFMSPSLKREKSSFYGEDTVTFLSLVLGDVLSDKSVVNYINSNPSLASDLYHYLQVVDSNIFSLWRRNIHPDGLKLVETMGSVFDKFSNKIPFDNVVESMSYSDAVSLFYRSVSGNALNKNNINIVKNIIDKHKGLLRGLLSINGCREDDPRMAGFMLPILSNIYNNLGADSLSKLFEDSTVNNNLLYKGLIALKGTKGYDTELHNKVFDVLKSVLPGEVVGEMVTKDKAFIDKMPHKQVNLDVLDVDSRGFISDDKMYDQASLAVNALEEILGNVRKGQVDLYNSIKSHIDSLKDIPNKKSVIDTLTNMLKDSVIDSYKAKLPVEKLGKDRVEEIALKSLYRDIEKIASPLLSEKMGAGKPSFKEQVSKVKEIPSGLLKNYLYESGVKDATLLNLVTENDIWNGDSISSLVGEIKESMEIYNYQKKFNFSTYPHSVYLDNRRDRWDKFNDPYRHNTFTLCQTIMDKNFESLGEKMGVKPNEVGKVIDNIAKGADYHLPQVFSWADILPVKVATPKGSKSVWIVEEIQNDPQENFNKDTLVKFKMDKASSALNNYFRDWSRVMLYDVLKYAYMNDVDEVRVIRSWDLNTRWHHSLNGAPFAPNFLNENKEGFREYLDMSDVTYKLDSYLVMDNDTNSVKSMTPTEFNEAKGDTRLSRKYDFTDYKRIYVNHAVSHDSPIRAIETKDVTWFKDKNDNDLNTIRGEDLITAMRKEETGGNRKRLSFSGDFKMYKAWQRYYDDNAKSFIAGTKGIDPDDVATHEMSYSHPINDVKPSESEYVYIIPVKKVFEISKKAHYGAFKPSLDLYGLVKSYMQCKASQKAIFTNTDNIDTYDKANKYLNIVQSVLIPVMEENRAICGEPLSMLRKAEYIEDRLDALDYAMGYVRGKSILLNAVSKRLAGFQRGVTPVQFFTCLSVVFDNPVVYRSL